MQYIDEIKALTVRVENGSGVIVKPLSDNYLYILTAHHVIKDMEGSGFKNMSISFLPESPFNGIKLDVQDVKICSEKDAAIIIVKKFENTASFIYPSNKLPEDKKGWHLGFPNKQNNRGEAKACVEHEIRNWLGHIDRFFVKYQCEQVLEEKEIDGMSGGGIFDCNHHLLGIHKCYATDNNLEDLGKFVMIPWECFESLINENDLAPVLPFELSSLKSFKEKIFCFDDNRGAYMKLKPLLAQLAIIKSSIENWSPKDCYEAFQQYRQARAYVNTELLEESDWVLFGEFLVAMKVLLKEHGVAKCEDIFPYFQYIQSDKDFDIYDVDNNLKPEMLGDVGNKDVVFVIGGITDNGYKQDVRPKEVLRINIARKNNGMLDIANLGKEVFGAFTFVNGNLFKQAMKENTDEIQATNEDLEDFYKKLLSDKIWPIMKSSTIKA